MSVFLATAVSSYTVTKFLCQIFNQFLIFFGHNIFFTLFDRVFSYILYFVGNAYNFLNFSKLSFFLCFLLYFFLWLLTFWFFLFFLYVVSFFKLNYFSRFCGLCFNLPFNLHLVCHFSNYFHFDYPMSRSFFIDNRLSNDLGLFHIKFVVVLLIRILFRLILLENVQIKWVTDSRGMFILWTLGAELYAILAWTI